MSYAQAVEAAEPEISPDLFLDAENGWQTYVNGRFGMRLSYPPDLFTPAEAIQSGDGRRFQGEYASMEVFGWENERAETSSSLAEQLLGSEGYEGVFEQRIGGDRLILSGSRQHRDFYELYVFRGRTVQAFGIEYPTALRSTYEPLREAIAATFLHGDEAASLEVAGIRQDRRVQDTDLRREYSEPSSVASAIVAPPGLSRPVFPQGVRMFFHRHRADAVGGKGPEVHKHAGKPPKARGHGPKRPKGKGRRKGKGKGKKR